MTDAAPVLGLRPAPARLTALSRFARGHPLAAAGAVLLALIALAALLAPLLGTVDPMRLASTSRMRPPSEAMWLGTDQFGRDVYNRVVYGARVSLIVGLAVSVLAIAFGLAIGLLA